MLDSLSTSYWGLEGRTKVDPRVEASVCAEKIQRGLSIITFASFVNFCLRKHNQGSAVIVPLQLDLVPLEKVLLGDRSGEIRDVEHSDGSRLALYAS